MQHKFNAPLTDEEIDLLAIDSAERAGWTGETCSLSAAGWARLRIDGGLTGGLAIQFHKDAEAARAYVAHRNLHDRDACDCGRF